MCQSTPTVEARRITQTEKLVKEQQQLECDDLGSEHDKNAAFPVSWSESTHDDVWQDFTVVWVYIEINEWECCHACHSPPLCIAIKPSLIYLYKHGVKWLLFDVKVGDKPTPNFSIFQLVVLVSHFAALQFKISLNSTG